MAVAAAEVAVGLAILIAHHYHSDSSNIDDINVLKW
jgi:NADH:ubiquinone oxidoreductase subunit K